MNVRIVIEKAARRLTLYQADGATKTYSVALGSCPVGPKTARDDGRTPEGKYYICTRNERSRFHLFLGLSYPNIADAAQALAEQRITLADLIAISDKITEGLRPPWDTDLGGEIGIHGHGAEAEREGDWTAGCIALDDSDIEELWRACPIGTEVVLLP